MLDVVSAKAYAPCERDALRCLPARFYTDPEILRIEREALFFRTWQYACHADAIPEAGDFTTISIFDQELFLVRGRDGEVRAFYNVCPHRGHRLVEGQGRARRVVCPYHAWTYNLDGSLFRVRGPDGACGRDVSGIRLSEVRVDRILDFFFVNLDPEAQPLDEQVPGIGRDILMAIPDLESFLLRDDAEYFGGVYDCNWKVALDNALECYHCEVAHKSFSDIMNMPGILYEFRDGYTYQHIPTAGKAQNQAYALDLEKDTLDGHFWYVFPNTYFSVFPGTPNFSVSRFEPQGTERMIRKFDTFTPPDVDLDREAARSRWGFEVVNQEDRALCENVQRGMRQRGYDRGWYLVDPEHANLTEEGVRFFHRKYLEEIGPMLGAG